MAKVLLIHPASSNPAKSDLVWPSLGLCRIASYLEAMGHEVMILQDALYRFALDEIVATAIDSEVDFVGIGAMTVQADRALEIAEAIALKGRGKPKIVAGGPHFAALGECEAPLDAVVIGDGELAMQRIITKNCRGVVRGRQVGYYLPIEFKWIEYEKYGDHLINGMRAISILTSRGCPFRCKFCGSPKLFGRKVVDYPVKQVVENIFELTARYGIKAVRIMDDVFTLRTERVRAFCDLVKGSGLTFACLTNVGVVRKPDLRRMKRSGFKTVAIGAESGCKAVLKEARKNINPKKVLEVARVIKEVGLGLEVLFMIGLPGETVQTLVETEDMAIELREIGADRIHFQFFTPFPGCAFADEIAAGQHGTLIEKHFREFHHRKPVFLPFGISYDDLMEVAERLFKLANREIGT